MELEVIAPEGAPAPSEPFSRPPEAPEAEPKDLHSIIDRALDGHEDAEARADGRKHDNRDEKGRFTAKDPTKAPAPVAADSDGRAPAAQDAPPVDKAQSQEASVTAENADPKTAPVASDPAPISEGHFRGWSSDERAQFNSLPKDAQDFVLSRQKAMEGNYTRKLQEAGEFRKSVEPLANVTQEFGDYFAALGAAPHEAIRNMVAVSRVLDQGTYAQKVDILSRLAQTYGLPFAIQRSDDPTAPGGERYAETYDQRVELANTRAELERIKRAQEAASQQQFVSQVQAFASQTDASGQPKYPFFEQVRGAMSQLMLAGQAQTLEDAYSQATKPIQAAIDAERQRVRAETERAQREAAEKARRASPVRASPAAPNGVTRPSASLNDLIGSALDRAGIGA